MAGTWLRGWDGAPWQRELLLLSTVPLVGLVLMLTAASRAADDGRTSTIVITFAAFAGGALAVCARGLVLWRRSTLSVWDSREIFELLARVRASGRVRIWIGLLLVAALTAFLCLVPGTPRTATLAAFAGCMVFFGSFLVARHFLHYAKLDESDETLLH